MTGNDESGTGSSTLAVAGGRPITPFLSNDEATSFLRLSPRTPEKYGVIGGGSPFYKLGRRVFYKRTDLEDWAGRRLCDSTSDPGWREGGR